MDLKAIAREIESIAEEACAHSEYFRNNPIIHDWADRVKIYADWADRLFGTAKEVRKADKVLVPADEAVVEAPKLHHGAKPAAAEAPESKPKAGTVPA